MGGTFRCHANHLSGDEFVALAFGLLHRPGDEFIGGHAGGRGRTHAADTMATPSHRRQVSPAAP